MKTLINDKHLVTNDTVNPPALELQLQHKIEADVARVNMHVLENVSEYAEKLAVPKAGKVKNSKLYIKNMVSISCIMVMEALLKALELHYTCVELGKIEIAGDLTEIKRDQLKAALLKLGFELLEDRNLFLIERIKKIIIEMVQYDEELPKTNFSDYLSKQLNQNYTYLSNLFSKVKGTTIEHFILAHKIERVKELLVYNELTLSEIAWKLHYSSVAHLSNQFKKITGLTPTHFKNMKEKRLIPLEHL